MRSENTVRMARVRDLRTIVLVGVLAGAQVACGQSATGGSKSTDGGTHAPGTTGDSSGGGSADAVAQVEPTVYIAATLGPTTSDGGPSTCPVTTAGSPYLSVGSQDNPVPNAGIAGVNTVAVSCNVHATGGDHYSVSLSVYDGNVAEITIHGDIDGTSDAAQGGVSATLSQSSGSTTTSYSESDCTLTLSTNASATISAGRIWATLDCPAITDVENGAVCDAAATFIFQNCTE